VSPQGDLGDLVGRVRSASLVDAMGRTHDHRCHVLDLVTPTPGRVLFGPAVTIGFVPYRADLHRDEEHSFAAAFHRAIADAPHGTVLVLASSGNRDVSLGGGVKLLRATTHSLAGVLAEARLRDFDELARQPFVTYCRGETPQAGTADVMPFRAGEAVVFDRVTIVPGDYVYADRGGAVVLPASDVRHVLESAAEIEEEDRRLADGILADDRRRHAEPSGEVDT
jgi:4-hydroxy-4-methyl-2-oxoglutarate aldolase